MAQTKSILIIGGSGFIGGYLASHLRKGYKVFATYFKHRNAIPGVTYLPLDIESRNWTKRIIYTSQPHTVIYAAGSNGVEWSEKNAKTSERLHADGPTTVATSTDIIQPRIIYLSNAYLFDGSRGNYKETDTILPGTSIGRMKSGGENAMRSKCLNYIILRSSVVFGRSVGLTPSFVDLLRMSLDRGKRIELDNKELHSFVPAQGLAEVVSHLIGSGLKNRVLHYGGLTKTSYYEFGRAFAKRFGYDHTLIVPKGGNSNQDQEISDYSLNFTQAVQSLKIKPLLLEESFNLIEKQLIANP